MATMRIPNKITWLAAASLLLAAPCARASDPHAAAPAHAPEHAAEKPADQAPTHPAEPMSLKPQASDHGTPQGSDHPPADTDHATPHASGHPAPANAAPAAHAATPRKKASRKKPVPKPAAAKVAAVPAQPPAAPAPHAAHWAYEGAEGPAHWGDIKPEFKACSAGRSQSPIDIDSTGAARLEPLAFHYKVSVIEMVNNGHTVQANYGTGSYITVGAERYDLLQFHFHTPSEHRVAGRSFPMEIHFVHRNARGQLAVVGVLVAPGDNNLAARELWDRLPAAPNSKSVDTRALMNARDLLPAGANYFRYSGSLTTPPCSEQVDWFVLQQPVMFSIDQIARVRGIMGTNARPTQARNGRYLLQAVDG